MASGSLSRNPRKDIRNDTKPIWFMAFKALLDVSLVYLSFNLTRMMCYANTHDRHHKIVMILSENSYTSFCAFSGAVLGFSMYCDRVLEICSRRIRPTPRLLSNKTRHALGINVFNGDRMCLLYISAQMS